MDEFGSSHSGGEIGAAMRLPEFARMLDYWQARKAGRAAPRRAEIDPLPDLPQLAPDMLLWSIVGGEAGYRCSLAGTRVCAAGGREFRGTTLADMPWEEAAPARREFDRAATTLEPHFAAWRSAVPGFGPVTARRLLLPLSEDGCRASMLWSLVTFAPAGGRRRNGI
jgi:hypothetical protein